ncbi:FtsQ-type POTRA domain-containing protein [Bacillus sp. S/N-304-OC-R1]|uniref:cell division protein FtsQ/DivIB n=1 Tax=Bacillus sp. S/N-304-OC-R1 TaxID=2758034 RepID=UPI001C8DA888|nr:FtsQ-type POTRA domain-containing protein [Bacillus sp. S/N-304-OC-R1]MBY0120789.1 FtsQ-type POTRA domain-containing protein [Bacillus sp. S/N-304-OC-R1]
MEKGKVVSLEDRIPKLKQQRRRKANRRLIFLLLLFFTLISFIIYFQSPLSHINKIEVKGNTIYSQDDLISVTGLSKEINIWKVEEKDIQGKLEKLPEVKSAKVQIQLPNSVEISIQEYKRIAYIMKEKTYLPVLENGKVLNSSKTSEIPANAPILIGFSEGNELNEMIKELEKLPEMVLNSISEIHHTPKKTDTYHVSLFMNDGFEVSATVQSFSEKMTHYPSIVSQLDPAKKGIIDLEVGSYFKAYEQEGAEQVEEENENDG